MMPCPISLLVVDDEEFNRDMLSRHLELNGYRVTAAQSGQEALALIEQSRFDLILLDVMMPEMSGLDVLQRLRRTMAPIDLPVIMVTAKSESEDIVEAFRLGANDYLTKPVDMPVALARVATQACLRSTLVALRESEVRYSLTARGTNDGLWDWNLNTNEIYFSTRWKSMLAYEESEISTHPDEWLKRVHPEDRTKLETALKAHCQGETSHFEQEYRILHRDGTYRWVLSRGMAVYDAEGRASRIAGSQTDITEGKVADPLTGLPNRILFTDRLEGAIAHFHQDPNFKYAVLFLDLDRFKVINDSLGHLIGDQLLIRVAQRLLDCMKDPNGSGKYPYPHAVARLGGDEFAILLEGIATPDDAVRIADRVQKALSVPLRLDGHEVFTNASIGITMGGPDVHRPEDLLRDADTAMYSAKARGKGRSEIFDVAMRIQATSRLRTEAELRQALEQQEFRVFYQPIQALETGRLIGFEALIRWMHPRQGLLNPSEFIPIAEEIGLMKTISWWTLREACRQMSYWNRVYRTDPPLTVSVNLSPKQFLQPDLFSHIEQALLETGMKPSCLKLEITENMLIDNPDATLVVLDKLRQMGIQISIDDFGTGYSSLNSLQRFPIDTLKIDRSFVSRMSAAEKNYEIVHVIVSLARTLGMSIIAEGIETTEQRGLLRTLGCEFGQGFLFSEPVEPKKIEAMLIGQYSSERLPGGPRNGLSSPLLSS